MVIEDAASLLSEAEEAEVRTEMETVAQHCNVGCYTVRGSSSTDVLDKAETWAKRQFGNTDYTVFITRDVDIAD